MADDGNMESGACSYHAGGGINLVWSVSMVGGETTSETKAFLLPWGFVAGVYLVLRGKM